MSFEVDFIWRTCCIRWWTVYSRGYQYVFIDIKESNFVCIRDVKHNYFHVSIKEPKLKLVTEVREECSSISVGSYLGCGLGTSASISLMLAWFKTRSYFRFEYSALDFEKNGIKPILEIAQDFEHTFHYRSSGVDVCVAYYGGLISFKQKHVEELSCQYLKQYKLMIFDSEISKHTGNVVKSKMNNKKSNINKLRLLSERAYILFKKNFQLKEIYLLIREGQDIL